MEDPCIIQDSVDRDPECCDPEEHKPVVLAIDENLIADHYIFINSEQSVVAHGDDFWRIRIGNRSNRQWIWSNRRNRTSVGEFIDILTVNDGPLISSIMTGFHRPEPKVASQPWKNQRKQRKCDSRPFKH